MARGEEAAPPLGERAPERVTRVLAELALWAMALLISAEIVLRGAFDTSLELTDEVGGYLLVAISFLALPSCLADDAFHRVEFIAARLSPRVRAAMRLGFDLLCFGFAAILEWQLIRLVLRSWQQDAMAASLLATPLWIPQLAMPVGIGVLLATLVRSLAADWTRLRAAGAPR
jgi:TRAP-type C4-dicarboxylate transport system permease small subunit